MSFPPLRMAVLTGLRDLKENLQVLDDPQCPYDEEVKRTLRELLAPHEVEVVVEKVVAQQSNGRGRPSKEIQLSEEDRNMITGEINNLIKALNDMGTGEGLETNERIQITKTKSALVQQLLQMRERNTHSKRMEEFMENVISILNDLVPEETRGEFLRRLEPYR